MNENHTPDKHLLERIEAAVQTGHTHHDAVLQGLAQSKAQADPSFRQALEDDLLNHLQSDSIHTKEYTMATNSITVPEKTKQKPKPKKRSRIPYTTLAAVFAVIIIGGFIFLQRSYSGLDTSYSMIDCHMIVEGQSIDYSVREGDTLLSIAEAHNVDPSDIIEANCLATGWNVSIGDVLTIPLEDSTISSPRFDLTATAIMQQATAQAALPLTQTVQAMTVPPIVSATFASTSVFPTATLTNTPTPTPTFADSNPACSPTIDIIYPFNGAIVPRRFHVVGRLLGNFQRSQFFIVRADSFEQRISFTGTFAPVQEVTAIGTLLPAHIFTPGRYSLQIETYDANDAVLNTCEIEIEIPQFDEADPDNVALDDEVLPVLIATRDIAMGEQITAEMVTTVRWSEAFWQAFYSDQAAAIPLQDPNLVVGNYAAQPISALHPITQDRIREDCQADCTPTLPNGYVAVMIPLDRFSPRMADRIGSRFDILAAVLFVDTETDAVTATPRPLTTRVITDAILLAHEVSDDGTGSVILAVSAQDAEILTHLVETEVSLTFVPSRSP